MAGDTARAAISDEVKVLRKEARNFKEVVAEQALELRSLKKHDRGWGRRRMRYPASEKLEIIRRSRTRTCQRGVHCRSSALRARPSIAGMIASLPAASTLWRIAGLAEPGLEPHSRGGARPIIELALNEPELSPRELAVTFNDMKGYFASESSVYRLLKVQDLITSPTFIVINAVDEFHDKTTPPKQLWQTDCTHLKVIGWGWFYLSTVPAISSPGSYAPP